MDLEIELLKFLSDKDGNTNIIDFLIEKYPIQTNVQGHEIHRKIKFLEDKKYIHTNTGHGALIFVVRVDDHVGVPKTLKDLKNNGHQILAEITPDGRDYLKSKEKIKWFKKTANWAAIIAACGLAVTGYKVFTDVERDKLLRSDKLIQQAKDKSQDSILQIDQMHLDSLMRAKKGDDWESDASK